MPACHKCLSIPSSMSRLTQREAFYRGMVLLVARVRIIRAVRTIRSLAGALETRIVIALASERQPNCNQHYQKPGLSVQHRVLACSREHPATLGTVSSSHTATFTPRRARNRRAPTGRFDADNGVPRCSIVERRGCNYTERALLPFPLHASVCPLVSA